MTTYIVTSEGATTGNTDTTTLNGAIRTIDTGPAGNYVIDITGPIDLNSELLAINLPSGSTLTIQGTNGSGGAQVQTIDGSNQTYSGFFVYSGDVTIENLTLQNMKAQGGSGGGGAGGGAGLGGALFIADDSADGAAPGNVTLSNVTFVNDAAQGGSGGAWDKDAGQGGGGGLGGDGNGGGGGVGGAGAVSGAGSPGIIVNAAAGGSVTLGIGGASGGGGGAGSTGLGFDGPIDEGGGILGNSSIAGGFGGGGGFASNGLGGGGGIGSAGGFGGGGGGGGNGDEDISGNGGFGGGGGGGNSGVFGTASGGFGGGDGVTLGGGGGGGLGAGGDIFVEQGASLTIAGTDSAGAGTVSGGTGGAGLIQAGQSGQAFANGIYLQGDNTLTFDPTGTETIAGVIGDDKGSAAAAGYAGVVPTSHLAPGYTEGSAGITVDGTGTLVLNAVNTYDGATTVEAGTLIVNGSIADSAVQVEDGATFGGNGSAGAVTVDAGGSFAPGDPSTMTVASLSLANGANFDEEIGGISPGTGGASGYDQTIVQPIIPNNGTISLGGATLDVSLVNNFTPSDGDAFTIIKNDTGSAVSGSFVGLTQGATFGEGGVVYSINYASGLDDNVVLTVVGPQITTTQQPATATVGTKITDQATVSGGDDPTGTVTFNLYNNPNGAGAALFTDTEPLSGGTATSASYTTTATGTDYWVATYNGDLNNSSVSSGDADESVAVNKATPAVATSAGATAGGIVGTSQLSDSATVSGGDDPTGMISFTLTAPDGTTSPVGVAVSVSGDGIYNAPDVTATEVGTYTWHAGYSGDANNTGASDNGINESLTVIPATPTVATQQQPGTATIGGSIADTATVTGGDGPTGTVTFNLYNNPNGTGPALFTDTESVNANGVATSANYATTATGTDYWVATYSGDTNNNPVSSSTGAEPVVVSPATPAISTTPNATTVTLGANPVTLTDTADLSSAFNPSGSITFTLVGPDGTALYTDKVTVSGDGIYATASGDNPGGFTLPNSGAATGTYQWDATYSGDANNSAASDVNNPDEQVVVSPRTPTVTASASDVNASASETFTPAQLFSASDAAGEPILSYEVEDETSGSSQGFWVLNDTVLPNGQVTTLTAAQLSELSFVAGSASAPVSDTLQVAAADAAGLGAFTTFTVTAAAHVSVAPPVVTAANELEAPSLTLAASGLFSATASGGNTIASYEVEDTTADSGYWVFNGTVEPTNQLIDVTAAQLSELSFVTGYGSDTLMVRANDGSQWSSFTSFTVTPPPNAAPPAGTEDTLVIERGADGAYEFYDIGHNTIQLDGALGAIDPSLQVAGLGGFDGGDTADLLMRDPTSGAFTLYDVSNNNITGTVSLGQVGTNWQVAGFGDFSGHAGETDMLMRDGSGAFEVYDIANNAITFATSMGAVGTAWQVAGFGDFSGKANETDMLLRNSATGAFEVYDISNNAITSSASMGQVGLTWQVAGFGDFSGNANETDMLMRNSTTGAFEVYDIGNNAITSSASMGQVGLEWTIAGFGDFSGNADETDMLMQDSTNGKFEIFDISKNAITSSASMGQVGLEWSIAGLAAGGAGAPPSTQLSGATVDPAGTPPSSATAQLTQAMASFAPSASVPASSSPLEQAMAVSGPPTVLVAAANYPQALS